MDYLQIVGCQLRETLFVIANIYGVSIPTIVLPNYQSFGNGLAEFLKMELLTFVSMCQLIPARY